MALSSAELHRLVLGVIFGSFPSSIPRQFHRFIMSSYSIPRILSVQFPLSVFLSNVSVLNISLQPQCLIIFYKMYIDIKLGINSICFSYSTIVKPKRIKNITTKAV